VEKGEKLALLRNIGTSIGIIFAFLALLGLILVAIFPMYMYLIFGHGAGALLFFFSATIFSGIFTISIVINKKWSKWHFLQIIATIFVIITLVMLMASAVEIPGGVDMLTFLSQGTPLWMRFWEWMYLYGILSYISLMCIFVWKYE